MYAKFLVACVLGLTLTVFGQSQPKILGTAVVKETAGNATNLVVNGAKITGPVTNTILTPFRALILDTSGRTTNSPVLASELAQVAGVTSPIQTQIDAITALAGAKVSQLNGSATNLEVNGIVQNGAETNTTLTASLPVQTDANKKIISGAILLSGAQVTGILGTNNLPSSINHKVNDLNGFGTNTWFEHLGVGTNTQTESGGFEAFRVEAGTNGVLAALSRNGVMRLHLVDSGSVQGMGLFGSYFALENSYEGFQDPQFRVFNYTNGAGVAIYAYNSTNPAYLHNMALHASGTLTLDSMNGGATGGQILIPSGELVGIGTTPSATLDINGGWRAGGATLGTVTGQGLFGSYSGGFGYLDAWDYTAGAATNMAYRARTHEWMAGLSPGLYQDQNAYLGIKNQHGILPISSTNLQIRANYNLRTGLLGDTNQPGWTLDIGGGGSVNLYYTAATNGLPVGVPVWRAGGDGRFTASGIFTGNGSDLTNLPASSIASGVFASARIPTNAVQQKVWVKTNGVAAGVYDFVNFYGANTTNTGAGLDVGIPAGGGGSGTVTSVALASGAGTTVSGSPVTGAGTLGWEWSEGPTGSGAFVRRLNPVLLDTIFINQSGSTNNAVGSIGYETGQPTNILILANQTVGGDVLLQARNYGIVVKPDGRTEFAGGQKIFRQGKAGNYQILVTDHYIVGTTTGTKTLPDASNVGAGVVIIIKSASGVTTTVAASAGDTVEGGASDSLGSLAAGTYVSDGATNWEKIAAK